MSNWHKRRLYFGSAIILDEIHLRQTNVCFSGNNGKWREHNIGTSTWWGIGFGGTPIHTLKLILGGTPKRRRSIAPRCRPQPITLEVARNTNILATPRWLNERGMWMYNIVWRYVEWTHMMRMFIPSVNVNQMSKYKYGLCKEVSHKIFGNWCKDIWEYIFMWLCQMLYAKVILGIWIH